MKLKLFDTLIKPIVPYASAIWICDFTIRKLKSDILPFEKIHNRFCKYLLGVHKKASNFASKCELGRLPIIIFINSLTFKYYSRLKEFPSTRLVKETFEVDKGLFNSGQKSWYSFISNSAKKDECQPYKFFSKGNPQIYNKPL